MVKNCNASPRGSPSYRRCAGPANSPAGQSPRESMGGSAAIGAGLGEPDFTTFLASQWNNHRMARFSYRSPDIRPRRMTPSRARRTEHPTAVRASKINTASNTKPPGATSQKILNFQESCYMPIRPSSARHAPHTPSPVGLHWGRPAPMAMRLIAFKNASVPASTLSVETPCPR